MSHPYATAATLAVALYDRTQRCIAEGPHALNDLIQACRAYANELEAKRDELPVTERYQCRDCKRSWDALLTYKRAGQIDPSSCPECFNEDMRKRNLGDRSDFLFSPILTAVGHYRFL